MRGTLWLFQSAFLCSHSHCINLLCVYEGESVYSQHTQVVISLSARCVIDYWAMDVRLAERFMHSDHLFLPERDRRNCWTLSMQSSRAGRITLAHIAWVSCIRSVHYSLCPWLTDWVSELHMPMLMLGSAIKRRSCIRRPKRHDTQPSSISQRAVIRATQEGYKSLLLCHLIKGAARTKYNKTKSNLFTKK